MGRNGDRRRRRGVKRFFYFFSHGLSTGKPNGIRTARKLKQYRQKNRWADKQYNKSHLLSTQKAKPMGTASHAKGIVVERMGIEAKQPNSAIRKCVRVQLIKVTRLFVPAPLLTLSVQNGKKIAAFVPGDGCLNFIDENDEVLIAGFGRKGHAVGDIPGVRFKVMKVASVGLLALYTHKKEVRVSLLFCCSLLTLCVFPLCRSRVRNPLQ